MTKGEFNIKLIKGAGRAPCSFAFFLIMHFIIRYVKMIEASWARREVSSPMEVFCALIWEPLLAPLIVALIAALFEWWLSKK